MKNHGSLWLDGVPWTVGGSPADRCQSNVPASEPMQPATGSEKAVDNVAGADSFVNVGGGYTPNGIQKPHISPHLKGMRLAGRFAGFKDGHVEWRKLQEMCQRASGGRGFWW